MKCVVLSTHWLCGSEPCDLIFLCIFNDPTKNWSEVEPAWRVAGEIIFTSTHNNPQYHSKHTVEALSKHHVVSFLLLPLPSLQGEETCIQTHW